MIDVPSQSYECCRSIIRIRKNRSGSETGSDLCDKKTCMILEIFFTLKWSTFSLIMITYWSYIYVHQEKLQNAWSLVVVLLCKPNICQLLVTRLSFWVGAGIRMLGSPDGDRKQKDDVMKMSQQSWFQSKHSSTHWSSAEFSTKLSLTCLRVMYWEIKKIHAKLTPFFYS